METDLIREAKIIKITKQNYHGLSKSKKVWYETMKNTRAIYEEGDTPRTNALMRPNGALATNLLEHARQMERELNKLHNIADRACNLLNLKGAYHESYVLRNEIKKLKEAP